VHCRTTSSKPKHKRKRKAEDDDGDDDDDELFVKPPQKARRVVAPAVLAKAQELLLAKHKTYAEAYEAQGTDMSLLLAAEAAAAFNAAEGFHALTVRQFNDRCASGFKLATTGAANAACSTEVLFSSSS
jgi:hypothetical protein